MGSTYGARAADAGAGTGAMVEVEGSVTAAEAEAASDTAEAGAHAGAGSDALSADDAVTTASDKGDGSAMTVQCRRGGVCNWVCASVRVCEVGGDAEPLRK